MAVARSSARGVVLGSVEKGTSFYRAGLRRGDRILRINGEKVTDELDFHFSAAEEYLVVDALHAQAHRTFEVDREAGAASGVTLAEQPIRRCANRCVFCFIDQMPRGLRQSLYIKDEDVRLSLFNGNYLTLSAFCPGDLERVVKLGLSPLFISVHATDTAIRQRMLRNGKAPDILEQLKLLARGGIRFHTQIVVCPGYNDGRVLTRSVRDLLRCGTSLLSIAVVPVGLTRFHPGNLQAVDCTIATAVCRDVAPLSDTAAGHDGVRKVFIADEFFIKAKLPFPATSYYEDFPQIENGVGLVRQLLDSWQRCKRQLRRDTGRRFRRSIVLVTSVSAYPFISRIASEMSPVFIDGTVSTVAVENRLFGSGVTVAGLLCAADIIRQVRPLLHDRTYDEVVVPSVIFNFAGFTLDGFSRSRIERRLGCSVRAVATIEEVLR